MNRGSSTKLIIGSRGSELALWQAHWVKGQLERHIPRFSVEIAIIKTKGDKVLDSPLSTIGSKGLFTREIDEALLEGRIDLSVHSLKDLPTLTPQGMIIVAVTKRDEVHDAFISHPRKNYRSLRELPQRARIGTGSLRRKCQLLHYRPDLQIIDIRGNVPTRLQKLDRSEWDGIILAKAGLARLNFTDRITETVSTDVLLPAVGQGALAVEMRADDPRTNEIVPVLHHEDTAISTSAERMLLKYLEGGCQVPIGAYARIENGTFVMEALIGSLDGRTLIRSRIHGEPASANPLAEKLAETLFRGGGEKILREIRPFSRMEVPAV